MDSKKRVLVVDDEAQIIRVLRHILNAHGYAVHAAEDGEAALDEFDQWQPDLVLTDLQMPNVSGLELTRRLRSKSNVPIVILSVRNEEKTIVEALDMGADDYVTKPFGTDELLARLRSALRRVPERSPEKIDAGDFRIDIGAHSALLRNETLRLTPKEFDLLRCFVQNPGRVLTHTFLLRKVWGDYYTEQPEALRVLVASLRKKIEPDPSNPSYLLTEPWVGYRFQAERQG
jgi:two-component system KDP operon response regulator KdpE